MIEMTEQPKAESKTEAKTAPSTVSTPQIGVGIPPVTVNLSVPISKSESAPSNPAPQSPPETSFKAIVVTDTCPFCQGIKEYISQQGLSDKVKIINASTPEGRKFAIQHGIRGVPECVVVAGAEGKNVKVCSKEEFVKLLKEGS
jgi:glutaredoxin